MQFSKSNGNFFQIQTSTSNKKQEKITRKQEKQKQKSNEDSTQFFLISNSDTKMSVCDFLFIIADFFWIFPTPFFLLLFISFAKQHNIFLQGIPIIFDNKSFKYLIDVNKFLHNNVYESTIFFLKKQH